MARPRKTKSEDATSTPRKEKSAVEEREDESLADEAVALVTNDIELVEAEVLLADQEEEGELEPISPEEEAPAKNGESALTVVAIQAEIVPPDDESPITLDEAEELSRLEREVIDSFLTAARALRQIRDNRLYRGEDGKRTFEAYCEERFGYGKRLAYYYIDAANIADNLIGSEQAVHVMPTSESQVRPLKNLTPEAQRTVWEKAVSKANGKAPSLEVVKETVKEFRAPTAPEEAVTSFKEGDVCVVRPTTETLYHRVGFWGIVEALSEYSVTVRFYDRSVLLIPRDLERVELSPREVKKRAETLQVLQEAYTALDGKRERAVPVILHYFGKMKGTNLTPFEKGLLSYLRSQAKKAEEEPQSDKETEISPSDRF